MKNIFNVVIPVLNQHDVTEEMIQTWVDLAGQRVRFIFIDNGSDEPLSDQPFINRWSEEHDVIVLRNDENTGVYPTFGQGWQHSIGAYTFFSHNDVRMLEPKWDQKLTMMLRFLETLGPVGICGMFGAKGIGTPDIYKAPYDFRQLMRWDCVTVPSMVDAGGRKIEGGHERIMVLDGFSLIISRAFVDKALGGTIGVGDYPVHHNYDNDLCLESHFAGFRNYALDIDCKHHGGITSTRESWAEDMGTTDLKIHREAHVVMYEKYRDRLPVGVK